MFAIAVNALYTALRRRGTTRQLASTVVTCVVSALLLLPAIVWYNTRFSVEQAAISMAEVEVALVYVALFGWFLPLSITVSYCLFALPRTSTTSVHIPRQQRTTRSNAASAYKPPRHQPGIEAPYVFGEDMPWGWLEHRGGRFQGQRLALTRSVITLGRGEDNDIWLDDDMASRHHAELAWDQGQVYITDCDSLNGVLLNGRRIRHSVPIVPGNLLEIGSHRFLFDGAEQTRTTPEQDDPLTRHVWHTTVDLQTDSEKLSLAQPSEHGLGPVQANDQPYIPSTQAAETLAIEQQETAELTPISFLPQLVAINGIFLIRDGERAGQYFSLERPVMTVGRGSECDVVINDASISRCHAQILRQANSIYIQDLGSRNGTRVNDTPLYTPQLLQTGDIVCIGSIRLECISLHAESVEADTTMFTPMSFTPSPAVNLMNGKPVPLRLPSKPKEL